jgi:hypothetical protein
VFSSVAFEMNIESPRLCTDYQHSHEFANPQIESYIPPQSGSCVKSYVDTHLLIHRETKVSINTFVQ